MLDGKAYRAHFPDDPELDLAMPADAPSLRNSAALLAALAALGEPVSHHSQSRTPRRQSRRVSRQLTE